MAKELNGIVFFTKLFEKIFLIFRFLKFFYLSITFFITLILNSKILNLLNDFVFSLKIILKKIKKNYILFFLYDLILLNIFSNNNQKKSSLFSIIFLNSIAHYQHNNWNEKKVKSTFFIC